MDKAAERKTIRIPRLSENDFHPVKVYSGKTEKNRGFVTIYSKKQIIENVEFSKDFEMKIDWSDIHFNVARDTAYIHGFKLNKYLKFLFLEKLRHS